MPFHFTECLNNRIQEWERHCLLLSKYFTIGYTVPVYDDAYIYISDNCYRIIADSCELLKSAAIMTIAKLPMNLLLTVITGGAIVLIILFYTESYGKYDCVYCCGRRTV